MAKYRQRVTFVNENFGASKLAERFGVQRYPAVFVDDVLIARPRDFGYFGEGGKRTAAMRRGCAIRRTRQNSKPI